MKSIKNQYIDLKEGKMTETQFMRNVRMSLPQYVSNTTLFKQAEKILINKGIISEIKTNEALTPSDEMELENIVAKYVKDPDDVSKEMDAYSEKGFRGFSDLVQANLNRDEEFQSWVQRTSDEEEFKRETSESLNEDHTSNPKDKYTVKFSKSNNTYQVMEGDEIITDFATKEKAEKEAKRLNTLENIKQLDKKQIKEAKDTSATGYFNQDGKEQYGKFDEIDNMNGQEIMAGYVIEKLDNPDKDKVEIAKILIKNLKSDPYYYTNYKLTGVRGEKPSEFTSTKRKPGFDQMEEVDKNGNNFVDEKNKMQIVKEGLDSETAIIGISNPKKVKVGDKVKLQDQEVIITKIDKVKLGSGATSNKIFAKTKNGEIVSAKPAMFQSLDEATIGNPSFGGKTKKVNVGDKAKLQGQEVTITKIDYVKPGSGATQNKIIAKTKDGEQVSAKAAMFEPLDEATKYKLKELVRKMMKEMFDGRDNMTDVTGENN